MYSLFLTLILLFPLQVFAQGLVREIVSPMKVRAEIISSEAMAEDKRVIFYSVKGKEKLIAIGRIHTVEQIEDKTMAIIAIEEIIDKYMVMVGDRIEPIDFKRFEEKKVPGFNSLTLAQGKGIPAQYKELAYFGVFTSDGHTLDKGEILVSPFQLQYGVSDKFGVRVVNALWLDGYSNIGAKYRLANSKYAKITVNGFGAYRLQNQDWIAQTGGVLTMPINSKFQSHFMATFTMDPQYERARATSDLGLFRDSDIRGITEYITDSWDRVLYGPTYNVALQTFGGTVSYMWVWTTFHMSVGLATRDFSKMEFGTKAYYAVYDFFWRF